MISGGVWGLITHGILSTWVGKAASCELARPNELCKADPEGKRSKNSATTDATMNGIFDPNFPKIE